uniref:Uncharacterized protein n=1 Tax=Athene cunicularia TaxID=194338 RepID=A0A663MZG1_ATHCN
MCDIHGIIFSPPQNKAVRSCFSCPLTSAFYCFMVILPQALCKWLWKPNTNSAILKSMLLLLLKHFKLTAQ